MLFTYWHTFIVCLYARLRYLRFRPKVKGIWHFVFIRFKVIQAELLELGFSQLVAQKLLIECGLHLFTVRGQSSKTQVKYCCSLKRRCTLNSLARSAKLGTHSYHENRTKFFVCRVQRSNVMALFWLICLRIKYVIPLVLVPQNLVHIVVVKRVQHLISRSEVNCQGHK